MDAPITESESNTESWIRGLSDPLPSKSNQPEKQNEAEAKMDESPGNCTTEQENSVVTDSDLLSISDSSEAPVDELKALSPLQNAALRSIMLDYGCVRNHQNGTTNVSNSYATPAPSTSGSSTSTGGTKRKLGEHCSVADSEEGVVVKSAKRETPEDNRRQVLACPYWKRDSDRYRTCWITTAQSRALTRKSKRNITEEQQWFAVWDIVFPGVERPGSAYVDSELSEEMSSFQEYWENRGHNILMEQVNSSGMWSLSPEERDVQGRQILTRGLTLISEQWATSRRAVTTVQPHLLSSSIGIAGTHSALSPSLPTPGTSVRSSRHGSHIAATPSQQQQSQQQVPLLTATSSEEINHHCSQATNMAIASQPQGELPGAFFAAQYGIAPYPAGNDFPEILDNAISSTVDYSLLDLELFDFSLGEPEPKRGDSDALDTAVV
ncbi:hypothetical protein BJ170DRAFT_697815 [Xylariales sp. AK1849]|nr:hypothetical protein BJ170DRAFT_697815 [Xylariales sp. AK1849]